MILSWLLKALRFRQAQSKPVLRTFIILIPCFDCLGDKNRWMSDAGSKAADQRVLNVGVWLGEKSQCAKCHGDVRSSHRSSPLVSLKSDANAGISGMLILCQSCRIPASGLLLPSLSSSLCETSQTAGRGKTFGQICRLLWKNPS